MTTLTVPRPTRTSTLPDRGGSRFLWGLRAELTKLRSVRSTYWTLFAMIVVITGLGALICLLTANTWHNASASTKAAFDATGTSLSGMLLGQLIIAVLGTL